MAFATPGGRPSPASMLGGPAAGRGLLFTGYVPYQSTCAGQVAPASRMVAPNQVDNSGGNSGLALSIGPMPGAMPNTMSREAAAPPSAAPPRSFFRSIFARCAGEEQEQQAADAADALSIGPQPSFLHGTRRPLAAGQLGHLRILLMHSARPPIPLRRPSPALSRTCRPLSFASRAPHALPSYLCT